ncbi:MAG: sigma-54-dependent Fis family transcriptional regulator [Planctomycetaceae bacterium]|nr:MAG: sigma-54-dependent Fis family transcriptional regulator [Planctomycetaceae bacterium]
MCDERTGDLRLATPGTVRAEAIQPHDAAHGILGSVQDLRSLLGPVTDPTGHRLVFRSEAMRSIVDQAERFARSSATVLLSGESGTGKELVARLIHENSPRAHQRYVRVNCAALPETLTESELFGHDRGAFTGAMMERVGRFEWADKGTLLLDEISEVSLGTQAKLLRVLEEQELQRIGDNATRTVDVRVIATTNRDLAKEAQHGGFREDLYYRLNVLQIELPPLRDRPEDIPILVRWFLTAFSHESEGRVRDVSPSALHALTKYAWPGNVRQLRNVIHRACILARSQAIQPGDLPELSAAEPRVPDEFHDLSLAEIERRVILSCLSRHGGNKSAVARQLGITPRSIANKLKAYAGQKAA